MNIFKKVHSVCINIKKAGLKKWLKSHDFEWLLYNNDWSLKLHERYYSICANQEHLNRDTGGETGTSLSDESIYPLFCLAASKKMRLFRNFRKNYYYRLILEHVSNDMGKIYLNYIEEAGIKNSEWTIFQQNDNVGGAKKHVFYSNGDYIDISPSTLRYVKIYKDLRQVFDFEKINTIAEIGIGYGGQYNIICSVENISKYYLIDLPEVLCLSRKWIESTSNRKNVSYIDGTMLNRAVKADLLISNYAFTELRREVQDLYLKYVINNSKAGYIIYNDLGYASYGSYSKYDLLNIIEGSYIVEEKPLSYRNNCVIIWNRI